MAKRTNKNPHTSHTKSILTAAGIFAAGSVFGAVLHGPSESEEFVSETISGDSSVFSTILTSTTEETTDGKTIDSLLAAESEEEAFNSYEVSADVAAPSENEECLETAGGDLSMTPSLPIETKESVTVETEETVVDEDKFEWDWTWDSVMSSETEIIVNDFMEEEIADEPIIFEENLETEEQREEKDWMKEEDSIAASVTILHEDSSMTAELIERLEGAAVFWAPSGNKIHLNPECRSFKKGFTFAGTLDEAVTVRSEGWCGICSKNGGSGTNSYATADVLAACYTYSDFLAGIPAEAFGD